MVDLNLYVGPDGSPFVVSDSCSGVATLPASGVPFGPVARLVPGWNGCRETVRTRAGTVLGNECNTELNDCMRRMALMVFYEHGVCNAHRGVYCVSEVGIPHLGGTSYIGGVENTEFWND